MKTDKIMDTLSFAMLIGVILAGMAVLMIGLYNEVTTHKPMISATSTINIAGSTIPWTGTTYTK